MNRPSRVVHVLTIVNKRTCVCSGLHEKMFEILLFFCIRDIVVSSTEKIEPSTKTFRKYSQQRVQQ